MFVALALIAIAGGTLLTYLYDEGAPLVSRLSAGACVGLAGYGLSAFVFASVLGLTTVALVLAALTLALPLLLLFKRARRAEVLEDVKEAQRSLRRAVLHPSLRSATGLLLYALIFILLWRVYDRALFERADGIYTGLANNYGDLPFHLSIITSFVKGANFPPEDPTYAGATFTYPFLADFVAACFVRAGATLRGAMLLENMLLAMALTGLLYRWALVLTRDRAAAHLSPVLVFLSGGLGFRLLLEDARRSGASLLDLFMRPEHDFTIIPETVYRWGNALTTLLVPQRSMLLGLPLALVVFIQWWQAFEAESGSLEVKEAKRKTKKAKRVERDAGVASPALFTFLNSGGARRMIAAGAVAGLLPLAHAHTLAVVLMVGFVLALVQGPRRWRAWAAFFAVALVVAGPQMLWAARGSSVRAGTFFGWHFGWDRGETNVLLFWLKNTGLFIPLLVAALLWRRGPRPLVPRRLLLFYLPFTLAFIVPNLFKLAPWVWDNIKVLFYWYVASVPVVALLLARLWRRSVWLRAAVAVLVVALTLSGALDVWRVVSRSTEMQEFDREGIEFAAMIEEKAQARSLVLHAPIHNHPVYLSGRRSLMGYPGHIWTHGLDYEKRGAEIRRIYAGEPGADAALARLGVEYVVLSPLERMLMPVNDSFFERYEKVGEVGEYGLYKIARP
ncbi:MAG TPA: hypothetical protein VE842_20060 [Pyrinomonadaceae bacterium]|jgi:hypothetical protein|nr:hypothetical protein [Pyrinomonadaceae bacterium]